MGRSMGFLLYCYVAAGLADTGSARLTVGGSAVSKIHGPCITASGVDYAGFFWGRLVGKSQQHNHRHRHICKSLQVYRHVRHRQLRFVEFAACFLQFVA